MRGIAQSAAAGASVTCLQRALGTHLARPACAPLGIDMAAADPALPFASEDEIEAAYLRSKELFATGETKPIAWRLKQLRKLRAMIVKHGATIESAIVADMHRAE